MVDQVTAWIKTGLKIFAKEGHIEVNTLCKKHGKSKSSFYNIYPNVKGSRGFDRYMDDLFEHHYRIVNSFSQILATFYHSHDLDTSIKEIVRLSLKYATYQACSARMRYLSPLDKRIKKYWKVIEEGYLKLISDFYIYFNIPHDSITVHHDMRLYLDSYLHYSGKAWAKEYTDILKARQAMQKHK